MACTRQFQRPRPAAARQILVMFHDSGAVPVTLPPTVQTEDCEGVKTWAFRGVLVARILHPCDLRGVCRHSSTATSTPTPPARGGHLPAAHHSLVDGAGCGRSNPANGAPGSPGPGTAPGGSTSGTAPQPEGAASSFDEVRGLRSPAGVGKEDRMADGPAFEMPGKIGWPRCSWPTPSPTGVGVPDYVVPGPPKRSEWELVLPLV
jgi:hypothetical protein